MAPHVKVGLLSMMCYGCKQEGCDYCILANTSKEDEYPDGIILFDRAVAAGLIRKVVSC